MNKISSEPWWKTATAYQIYPRSFMDSNNDGVGDLQGIIAKLDYLKWLGVDLIWIGPIYQSPNDDNGYDISDYQKIMAEFGSIADFDLLLQKVHQLGMKLIMDLVINHTSDEHPWFIESRSSKLSSKRDWYLWHDDVDKQPPNNWESIFKGSVWQYDQQTQQNYFHLFSQKQPDLNWENEQMQQAIFAMIRWWLEKGIDGFRLDAITHIQKDMSFANMPNPQKKKYVSCLEKCMNYPGILSKIDKICQNTFNYYPDIVTVGEANGVSHKQVGDWVGSDKKRLNMIFSFEHLDLWQDEDRSRLDIIALKQKLSRWQKALHNKGWNALFIENHDITRVVSRWGNDAKYWQQSATAFATIYFLMEGTPFIYQGQEIGMTNSTFATISDINDVNEKNRYKILLEEGVTKLQATKLVAKTTRDNARTPMQWSNAAHAGFSESEPWIKVNPNYVQINVEQQLTQTDSILNYYRQLIQLRKQKQTLLFGQYQLILPDHPQIYAYIRQLKHEKIVVITNLTQKSAVYEYADFDVKYNQLCLANISVDPHRDSHKIKLKPYESRVYVI